MNIPFFIADIIAKKIIGELSESEQKQLTKWINDYSENRILYDDLLKGDKILDKIQLSEKFNQVKVKDNLNRALFNRKKVIQFAFVRYAAAIVLPLALITGIYFYTNSNSKKFVENNSKTETKQKPQKAYLVLSDGNEVELNSNKKPVIIDSDVEIVDTNRMLVYEQKTLKRRENVVLYNTLKTPRGSNYSITLADGTQVWLNAESELKYPVFFTDSVRQVFIKGEAFFDVNKNGKPFIVKSGEVDVRVLGTSFNISAYVNDNYIQTTLVEGIVQVEHLNQIKRILPNQQATVNSEKGSIEINQVETDIYTAWVKGKFIFKNEPLSQVMKKLARWYDFTYEFKNEKSKKFHFSGRLRNDIELLELISMLNKSTNLNITMQNNNIEIK